ncbi:MAG TPA: ATP-binding protein, partial [Allosphingosinicella sp.]|nr:ATP-binding protein [Allosphingosinicella sp.]
MIGGSSDRNPHNSPAWIAGMRDRYAGTRLERQELNGELLTGNPGALWTEALLERCRFLSSPSPDGEGDQVKPGGGVEGLDL